jgi:chromosomal replication initiation ATPase DnaA
MNPVEDITQAALLRCGGNKPKAARLLRDAADALGSTSGFHLAVRAVQFLACEQFGVSLAEMLGPRRNERISRARLCAIVVCRQLTRGCMDDLVEAFHRLHHTTVTYADIAVRDRCETNQQFRKQFEKLLESARAALAEIDGRAAA